MRILLFTFILFLGTIMINYGAENNRKVAISKGIGSENYELYGKWITQLDSNIEVVNLYGLTIDEALNELQKCDGLIISGGPDVHPAFYGQSEDTARCSIDNYRDTLEFALIKSADKLKLPMLAVCRGAQIVNVAYGGDLIVDIPEDFGTTTIHQVENADAMHLVNIDASSELYAITGVPRGIVNSNHHQAVGRLADIFSISAYTEDGIIEAYEYSDKSKPFFMAVQWHPERLLDDEHNILSIPIAESFLKAVKKR